jgi:plasmid maintenance system killer protein
VRILPLASDVERYLRDRKLWEKFEKQKRLFEENSRHPSLHTELLEPKQYKIYSFRIDRRYRAHFWLKSPDTVEILTVTDHYQRPRQFL